MTRVLFLCPHAAGKSVAAATYFRAAADRVGLDAVAAVAGTDPDAEVMPNVRGALEEQGLAVLDVPGAVSAEDVRVADLVVSIGCDHREIPADEIVEWDVPMLSEDFHGSMRAIRDRVDGLVALLARRDGAPPSGP